MHFCINGLFFLFKFITFIRISHISNVFLFIKIFILMLSFKMLQQVIRYFGATDDARVLRGATVGLLVRHEGEVVHRDRSFFALLWTISLFASEASTVDVTNLGFVLN